MKNKKTTVTILTYNSGASIAACLESLCQQTYRKFVVQIVDDDSTDNTLEIVEKFRGRLSIRTVRNGSHNIPRGRNIGLKNVASGIIAFIDSDDTADKLWLETIVDMFKARPNLAMVSGQQKAAHRTPFAESVTANDEAMRRLFGGGNLLFCTCNCAINRDVIKEYYFDENFINAEDIEFAERVGKDYEWEYVDNAVVHHTARDTVKEYIKQVYLYGKWKQFYSYRVGSFRIVDYVPIAVAIFTLIGSMISLALSVTIILFPIAQTIASIIISKPRVAVWLGCFIAWCIKDTAWSFGIITGLYDLLTKRSLRQKLLGKEIANV